VANLTQAQTALQASYSVTAKVLKMTIMDYI
jgi:flagellin-like hook-associated protein FlgL